MAISTLTNPNHLSQRANKSPKTSQTALTKQASFTHYISFEPETKWQTTRKSGDPCGQVEESRTMDIELSSQINP